MEQRGESSEHVSDQLHDPVRDQVTDRETNGTAPQSSAGAPPTGSGVAESARRAVGDVRHWVGTDRIRLFGSAAGAAFVLMIICLLLPHWIFSVLFAGMLAIIAAVLGVLAVGTWFAARRGGVSDTTDLWDSAGPDTATVDDLFTGFSGFTEDGRRSTPPRGE